MKKAALSLLVLSLLLAILIACSAQAQQLEPAPEPAPQADQTEPSKPVQLSEPEKTEISQEELEPIFEKVYTENSGNHPEDWSIDFQITDEIGKINKAIPEDKKAPANLREIYIEWRTAKFDTVETVENYSDYEPFDGEVNVQEPSLAEDESFDNWDSEDGFDGVYTGDEGIEFDKESLADSGLDFGGPRNIIDTTGGKTQEQIDQELQELLGDLKEVHFYGG